MRGLCREVGGSGEEGGSFFTIIFGGTPFRDEFGEPFDLGVLFGLPLPVRCADTFGVADADVRCAGGDFEGAEGTISTYDDRSWGAGEGAMVMAVLMVFLCERLREGGGIKAASLEIYSSGLFLPPNSSCAACFVSLNRLRASCVFLLST